MKKDSFEQLEAFFHLGRQKIGRLAEIFKSFFCTTLFQMKYASPTRFYE
jgi:hypothetical protein